MTETGLNLKPVRQRRLPQLNARLTAVVELVEPCQCLYDIGSDHAFLPIELIRRGVASRAVASDIGAGPIRSAQRNISRFALENKIATAVTPGLAGHTVTSEDSVVMAGLGGLEMIDIMANYGLVPARVILQPQKSAMELRRWLTTSGYQIVAERLVYDRDRIYPILAVEPSANSAQELTLLQAYLGPCLITDKPPLYREYLVQRLQHVQKMMRSEPELHAVFTVIQEELT